MPPKAGTLEKSWKDAKKKFERDTKVKKPAETVLFWRKGTGIETALKKVDAAADKAWRTRAGWTAYQKTVVSFTNVFLPYRAALDKAEVDAKKNVGIPNGVVGAAYVQGLQALNSELRAIETAAGSHQASALSAVNAAKNVPATITRAKAFIVKVKQTPTAVTFNGAGGNPGVGRAARDLTQQIGNFDKLKAAGMDTGIKNPTALFKILSAWADAGRKVEDNATQAEVLRELGAFEQAIAGVEKWWATVAK